MKKKLIKKRNVRFDEKPMKEIVKKIKLDITEGKQATL